MNPKELTESINTQRRSHLKSAMALTFTAALPTVEVAEAQEQTDTTRFFPGFTQSKVQANGVTINTLKAGNGPPLLLLHGAPQSHISWRLVAPELAKKYTVIVPDLRGYGDSSAPAGTADHGNYSKRVMAQDQIELMRHFGFKRFELLGHDRGGRVGHRMALDHPDAVSKLVLVDIVPGALARRPMCSASICASRASPKTFTACVRTIARVLLSTCSTTLPISTKRSNVQPWFSGPRKHRWAESSTCSRFGRSVV
jgi:pimeloyl-ACP methyl ester carboxylesterase